MEEKSEEVEAQINWRPQPKQELALSCPFFEIGIGGGRGGGKTETGIMWIEQLVHNPEYRGLVIRRNFEDLLEWIDRAAKIYWSSGGKRRYDNFVWPNGAIIRTGHFKDDKSFQKYVGHEYHRILIEELNLIPREENYIKLLGSCRSTDENLRPQIMSTFNPSDEGFYWIKKRFGIHGIPIEPVFAGEGENERVFIPMRISDNEYLSKDEGYLQWLDSLPDGLREAWRDGSWDDPQIQGGVYTTEILQAQREGRFRLYPINQALPVHTVWDLGASQSDSNSILFVQRTKTETAIVHYYENQGLGFPHYQAYLDEWQRNNQIRFGKHYAPFDIKQKEWGSGATRKQTAEKMGLKFEIVPSVKVQDGIEKARLMWPRLYISEPYCGQLISALKNYRRIYDEKMLQFKEEPIHDWASHAADCLRYLALIEEQITNEEKQKYIQPPRDLPSTNFIPGQRRRIGVDEMGNPIGNQRTVPEREFKYW